MEDTNKLAELRAQIDAVDERITALLNERATLALRVRIAKGNTTVYRPEREAAVIEHVTSVNNGPLSDEAIKTLFHSIIYVCRAIQDVELKER